MGKELSKTITLDGTDRHLQIGNSTLYKIVKGNKLPVVKIEDVANNTIIIRVPYNQELIKKIKVILGRR